MMRKSLTLRTLSLGVFVLLVIQGFLFYKKKTLSYKEFCSLSLQDRNGHDLRTVLSSRQGSGRWISMQEIPKNFVDAMLIAEDRRFYNHWGIDFLAIGRAARQNLKAGRIVSGGSTLTQQLVRIIRNYPRNFINKILEAMEAMTLELLCSKEELLAHYLNRAPYGNQCFGVNAASWLYFNKPPIHLSLAEAALLAGLPQSPSRFDPYRHTEGARGRQRWILSELLKNGKIEQEEYERAIHEPDTLVPKEKQFQAPHFADWILVQELPREKSVRTTLNLHLQKEIEDLAATYVKSLARENVTNASVVVMENRNHELLAMVGSADYFNEEHEGQVNGTVAPRLPGSTWKPFMYGIALEQGIPASRVLPDIELHAVTDKGDFTPRNFDEKFHGPVRLRTALACSYNIPAVRTLEQLGTDVLLSRLRDLGFSSLTQPATIMV